MRNSIEISEIKQYHRRDNILRYPENWVSLPKETLQMDHLNCICANDLYKLPESCKVVRGGPKPKLVNQNKNGIDICFVLDCTGTYFNMSFFICVYFFCSVLRPVANVT